MPRYEILDEAAMAGARARLAAHRQRARRSSSSHDEALELLPRGAGQNVEGELVKFDPDWILEQVAKAPREFDAAGPQPGAERAHRRRAHGLLAPSTAARSSARGSSGASATLRRLREPRAALAGVPAARLAGRDDLRAERQAARLAPPRHGLRAADALGQAVHGLGHVGPERSRHDRDGRDRVRRASRSSETPGDHLADQRQLAAPLRRPHARGAVRVREGEPGRRSSRRSC